MRRRVAFNELVGVNRIVEPVNAKESKNHDQIPDDRGDRAYPSGALTHETEVKVDRVDQPGDQ